MLEQLAEHLRWQIVDRDGRIHFELAAGLLLAITVERRIIFECFKLIASGLADRSYRDEFIEFSLVVRRKQQRTDRKS